MADPAPNDTSTDSYVRTYAKDAALLGGTQVQGKAKPATPAPQPAAARPDEPATPAWAPIPAAPVSNESRESILARLKKNAVPAPAAQVPKEAAADPAREAVLTRLKQNASVPSINVLPQTTPPPAVQAPTPVPLPPVAEPVRIPPPPVPPLSKNLLADSSPIHTYKTDFVDRTKKEGASRISVLASEQDAGTKAPQVLKPKKHTAMIVAASVLLLLAGSVSVYAAYRFVTGRPAIPVVSIAPSIIFADERMKVEGEGSVLLAALANAAETSSLNESQVLVVYLASASTTPGGIIEEPQPGGTLINALQLNAPDILLRNIAPESTVGIVHAGNETRAFFILRTTSYERTFAGMLEWESRINDELAVLYPAYPEEPVMVATSTATSTKKVVVPAPVAPAAPRFIDAVVANHDVRQLVDSKGRVILLYGYRDKETLIIARDQSAFTELLARMQSTRGQ